MNDQKQTYIRKPLNPPAHVAYAHSLGRGMLTFEQIDELVKPINPAYVENKQGKAYIAQHQARAEMNRLFGYGNWTSTVDEMTLMYEEQREGSDKKTRWVVGYRAKVTVEIRDLWGMPLTTFSEYHAEENAPQPNRGEAHALAMTSVESYALRRALIGVGDRTGLGLYAGGSTAPHGKYSIQQMPGLLFAWEKVENQAAPSAEPEAADAPQGVQQTPQMQEFHQVREQLQEERAQARQKPVNPDMAARLQAGLKMDS